jgi:hypothetical protein
MSITDTMIVDELAAAIAAKKSSLVELRGRIEILIKYLPVGALLADEEGEIGTIKSVCTGASQWSTRRWEVTIRGKGLIAKNGKLVAETCPRSYWDGNNMHYHTTEPFCLDTYERHKLSWLSGRETRAIALRLPRAIAGYVERCKAEEAANQKTVEQLDQQAPTRY